MTRRDLVRESELRKRQQLFWHSIRQCSPDKQNPNSNISKLFFYEQCVERGIPLDAFQQAEMAELPELIRIEEEEKREEIGKENHN